MHSDEPVALEKCPGKQVLQDVVLVVSSLYVPIAQAVQVGRPAVVA